jgi:hypothetical protein
MLLKKIAGLSSQVIDAMMDKFLIYYNDLWDKDQINVFDATSFSAASSC